MALPNTYPKEQVPAPGQAAGLSVSIVPGDTTFQIELQRTVDDGAGAPNAGVAEVVAQLPPAPLTGIVFTEDLPMDNVLRFYRYRHIRLGYTAGAWSSWSNGKVPGIVTIPAQRAAEPRPTNTHPAGGTIPGGNPRGYEFGDGMFAVKAVNNIGSFMPADIRQSDGVVQRVIAKGYITGQGRHADAVSFAANFQNVPFVLVHGGLLTEPRAKWGTMAATDAGTGSTAFDTAKPIYENMSALNVTVSGFTIRATLRQKSGTTAREDNFPSANVLDAEGETTEANLANAPSATDLYTAHFTVTISVDSEPGAGKPCKSGTVTVAVDTNDGGGWVERATEEYFAEWCPGGGSSPVTWSHEIIGCIVSGMGTNDDLRIRIKDVVTTAGVTFTAHGFNLPTDVDPSAGVTYNTASDNFASKTPDTEDRVTWEALAVA
jgi:hypothetical protein